MFKETPEYFEPILSQFVLSYIKCSTLSIINVTCPMTCPKISNFSRMILLAKFTCLWMHFTGIKTGTKLCG